MSETFSSVDSEDEEYIEIDQIIKILVVGNAKCGKSSIIGQYISSTFDAKYKTTVGADFARKDLYIELPNQEKIGVRLQLWDIAGQDRFQKLTRAYFSRAKGVVIVCDVSREGTVEAVRNWKQEINVWAGESDCKDIPVVLFANKADLLKDPQDALKTGAIMERSKCRCQNVSCV
jgi:Ras-related protein Rab-32